MPVIKVQTSCAPDQPTSQTLLKTLSRKLSQHLGKPESYVMTILEPNVAMTFAGTTDPVCFVEVKSLGQFSPALTKAMSQDFCTTISDAIGVDPSRTYIEFNNAVGTAEQAMWGWNGSTF